MKVFGGVDVQIHILLTSALAGGEWSASGPGRLTPGEKATITLVKELLLFIGWMAAWTLDPVVT
jgi:hypothetical protein